MGNVDYKQFYSEEASRYESTRYGSPYGRFFRLLQRRVLKNALGIAGEHRRILDVATGTGQMLPVFRDTGAMVVASDLTAAEQTRISEKFLSSPLETEQWLRLAASILSRTVQTAALVTPPVAETSRFKHLELISIQGRLVLMVLVLHGGSVHQQMLNLAEPVPQDRLSDVTSRINSLCLNMTANEMRMKSVQLQLLEREVADLAADLGDAFSLPGMDPKSMRPVAQRTLKELEKFQCESGGFAYWPGACWTGSWTWWSAGSWIPTAAWTWSSNRWPTSRTRWWSATAIRWPRRRPCAMPTWRHTAGSCRRPTASCARGWRRCSWSAACRVRATWWRPPRCR